MTIRRMMFAAMIGSTVCCTAANAQGRGKGRAQAAEDKPSVSVNVIFTDSHRSHVQEYLVAHPMRLQALPPGVAKNVARGKRLPPGIAKRAVPREVLVLLPRPQPGITFVIIGDMVVAERSGLVVDVMLHLAG